MRVISDGNVSHRLVKVRATKKELAQALGYDGLEVTLVFSTGDGWEIELVSSATRECAGPRGLVSHG